jgi:probable F420-dependent oxidoreductase
LARRPFRFGVATRAVAPGASWPDIARRIERLGYAVLTVPDHFRNDLAPVPALTAAAAATSRVRVGSLVFAVDFHHPAVLAREAAAIDHLSDGRFELGLGAGWLRSEYEETGIGFAPPGTRVDRLTEAVAIVKGLLGEGRFSFAGRHFTIRDLEARPGAQRPRMPIVIGGGGRRTLTLAAREADVVSFVPRALRDGSALDLTDITDAGLLEKLTWVREAAGPRFEALELHTLIQAAVVTADPARAAEGLAERFRTTPARLRECPFVLLGDVGEMCATLRHRRERYGISYVTVFDRDAEAFAPVVAQLAGT